MSIIVRTTTLLATVLALSACKTSGDGGAALKETPSTGYVFSVLDCEGTLPNGVSASVDVLANGSGWYGITVRSLVSGVYSSYPVTVNRQASGSVILMKFGSGGIFGRIAGTTDTWQFNVNLLVDPDSSESAALSTQGVPFKCNRHGE